MRRGESARVVVPLDFRLAEYLGRTMAGLVEEGIWERETLLNVLSYQVWQFAEGVQGLMTARVAETVVGERPGDGDVLFYQAELYQRRGELDEAEEAYRRVLAVNGEYAHAYLRLGLVAEDRGRGRLAALGIDSGQGGGDLAEAAAWYNRYHEVAPEDLLGLKRLAEVCGALESEAVEDESCAAAAQRVRTADSETRGQGEGGRGDTGEEGTPAAVLRGHWEERAAAAEPQHAVDQEFDNGWTCLGYDVDEERLVRGERVGLVLYWKGPEPGVARDEADGWWRAGERWVQVLERVQTLVLNGGFELGTVDGPPTSFPEDIYGASRNTRRLVTDTRDGQRTPVAWLANTERDDRTSFASGYVSVRGEGVYLQSGWMRSEGGNGYLGRRWAGDIGEEVRPYDYVVAGVAPESWTPYAGVTRPLQGANRCQIWLLNYRSGARVYFDDVALAEIGLPGR